MNLLTKRGYEAVMAKIDELLDAEPGTPEENHLMELVSLVKDYEREYHPMGAVVRVEQTGKVVNTMEVIYQVGLLLNPQPDNRTFQSKDEAERCALTLSINDNYSVFGVWREDDGELLTIAFQGALFTR